MKMNRGYMKNEMEHKKNIIIISVFAFCIVFSVNICNSVKSFKYRRHLDTVREQLIRSEEYNRELTERLRSISTNVQKLGELTERNVSGVRQCIEIIEETRIIVQELEDCCGSFNQSEYYSYWDNEFRDKGIMQ